MLKLYTSCVLVISDIPVKSCLLCPISLSPHLLMTYGLGPFMANFQGVSDPNFAGKWAWLVGFCCCTAPKSSWRSVIKNKNDRGGRGLEFHYKAFLASISLQST